MQRRILFALLILLFLAMGLLFRNRWINRVQQEVLGMVRQKADFSNAAFIRPGLLHDGHRIYSLKGIDRLWPHRVNSMQRLRYLYPYFAGFECDIRFDGRSGQLFVAHEAAEINSLVFSDYLGPLDRFRKLFWLDIKNLDSLNLGLFSSALEQLDQRYKIKDRVILESPNATALDKLNKSGWLCSLYLPSDLSESPEIKNDRIENINDFLRKNIGLISEDIRMHRLMTEKFPHAKQLIWDIRFFDSINKNLLLNLANDTTLLVCLINIKSPGYR
jgi:hypothetical protein